MKDLGSMTLDELRSHVKGLNMAELRSYKEDLEDTIDFHLDHMAVELVNMFTYRLMVINEEIIRRKKRK